MYTCKHKCLNSSGINCSLFPLFPAIHMRDPRCTMRSHYTQHVADSVCMHVGCLFSATYLGCTNWSFAKYSTKVVQLLDLLASSPGHTQLSMLHAEKWEGLVHIATWDRLVIIVHGPKQIRNNTLTVVSSMTSYHSWKQVTKVESHYSNCREAVLVIVVVSSIATFSLSKALVVLCYTRQVFDQCSGNREYIACRHLSIVLSEIN